jgi:ABC-type multidrug transport system ATPase subunit
VSHLTRYYGGIGAVLDVSFSVQPGEVLGTSGRTGRASPRRSRCWRVCFRRPAAPSTSTGENIQDHLLEHKAASGTCLRKRTFYTYLTAEEYLRLAGRLRGIPPARLERRIDRFLDALRSRCRALQRAGDVLEGHAAEGAARRPPCSTIRRW